MRCKSPAFYCCRNADGKIIKPAAYQSWLPSGSVSRVEPNRKWFGKLLHFPGVATYIFEVGYHSHKRIRVIKAIFRPR